MTVINPVNPNSILPLGSDFTGLLGIKTWVNIIMIRP